MTFKKGDLVRYRRQYVSGEKVDANTLGIVIRFPASAHPQQTDTIRIHWICRPDIYLRKAPVGLHCIDFIQKVSKS